MEQRGVAAKSEIDDLFHELWELYAQQRMPVVDCGLPFPLLQVAEARVWRGIHPPDAADFHSVSAHLARFGLPARETEAIVAIAECAFRLMRPAELEIEARLPDLFFNLAGPLTFAADRDDVLVRAEFTRLRKAIEAEVGGGWVLAATRRPVWVAGRPSLFSHEVCAAIVAERLVLDGVLKQTAHSLGADLASVLSDRRVDADEVRCWQEQYGTVRVLQSSGQSSLTRFLAYPRDQLSGTGIQWTDEAVALRGPWLTPADFLAHWRLPIATAAQIARLVSRGPYRQGRRQAAELAACWLCDTEEMPGFSIWNHLHDVHSVAEDALQSGTPGITEIHDRRTGQVLATLRKGPPLGKTRSRR